MHSHRCPSLPARLEVLRDKQGQLGTHGPQEAPSLCPGSCPRKSFHSPAPQMDFPSSPSEAAAWGRACDHRAHRAQSLCPATRSRYQPGTRSRSQECPQHTACCRLGQGGLPNGVEAWPRAVPDPAVTVSLLAGHLPFPPPGVPPSPASAPGVAGGSATAQAVAPLPGAVDEAQGVLKLLLAGGFVDGLVGEVHLVDGSPAGAQCRQEPVQFRGAAQVDDPRWGQLLALLGELLGRQAP